jgi:hypothetical protein
MKKFTCFILSALSNSPGLLAVNPPDKFAFMIFVSSGEQNAVVEGYDEN